MLLGGLLRFRSNKNLPESSIWLNDRRDVLEWATETVEIIAVVEIRELVSRGSTNRAGDGQE